MKVLKTNKVTIATKLEFAKTLFHKILGLMFRKNISEDFAIIFILKKPSSVGIHTLFVFFPIDVIFLDKNKKISKTASLPPFIGYSSMKNISYIIEMKAGSIKKHDLSIGKEMEF